MSFAEYFIESGSRERLEQQIDSLFYREPARQVDTPFLNDFFSSSLFKDEVNREIERVKEGMILGEVGCEFWLTKERVAIQELIPFGVATLNTPLTPELVIEKIRAGQTEFLSLHFHPQQQWIVKPTIGFTPGEPDDVFILPNFYGDLVAENFNREVYRVFTGYDIFPIMIVGGVNFKARKTFLLFCQDTGQQERDPLRFSFYNRTMAEIEQQDEVIAFLQKIGYKAALFKWKGSFSEEDLAELSQFAFISTRLSDEERFNVSYPEPIIRYLKRDKILRPKVGVNLNGSTSKAREVLAEAVSTDKFVHLKTIEERLGEVIGGQEESGDISREEAERLREILESAFSISSAFTKETIKGLTQEAVSEVLRELFEINPDISLTTSEQARITRIIKEVFDKKPHG